LGFIPSTDSSENPFAGVSFLRRHPGGMLLTQLATTELLRLIRAGERSPDPDRYALAVLREELERRQGKGEDSELAACGKGPSR